MELIDLEGISDVSSFHLGKRSPISTFSKEQEGFVEIESLSDYDIKKEAPPYGGGDNDDDNMSVSTAGLSMSRF